MVFRNPLRLSVVVQGGPGGVLRFQRRSQLQASGKIAWTAMVDQPSHAYFCITNIDPGRIFVIR
jgi:hypothetical protein